MLCKFVIIEVLSLLQAEFFCYQKNVVTLAKLFISMTAIVRIDAFEV